MDQMTFPIQGKTSMTPEDVKNMFYEQIERDSRFDKSIHAQYMGMDRTPAWYKGPADSREMARALVDSTIDRVWSVTQRDAHLFPVDGATKWTIASGCLQVVIFALGDNTLGMEVSFTTHDTPTYTVKLTQ